MPQISPQSAIELALAFAAVLLLGRDLRRAWRDELKRPISLLVAALVAALLIGSLVGHPYPSPWWLLLPVGVLVWEVERGWRQTPRCHFWEAGIAALGTSLLFAAVGLAASEKGLTTTLLALAAMGAILGISLLRRSRRSEPRPWRVGDPDHYERRGVQRKRG